MQVNAVRGSRSRRRRHSAWQVCVRGLALTNPRPQTQSESPRLSAVRCRFGALVRQLDSNRWDARSWQADQEHAPQLLASKLIVCPCPRVCGQPRADLDARRLVRSSESLAPCRTKLAVRSCLCCRTTDPSCPRGISPNASLTAGPPPRGTSMSSRRRGSSASARKDATAGTASIGTISGKSSAGGSSCSTHRLGARSGDHPALDH
jgi:hypothetical protein